MTQIAMPVEIEPVCQRCRSAVAQHTHHRNRNRKDNRPENLRRLCPPCHLWVHDNVAQAYEEGWLVHSWEDPTDIVVTEQPPPRGHDHADLAAGQRCPTCKRVMPKPRPEKPRQRTTVSMKVPADERENGAVLWEERIQLGRELLCEVMGWEPDVPAYYVAMALVDKGLESSREDVRQMADA